MVILLSIPISIRRKRDLSEMKYLLSMTHALLSSLGVLHFYQDTLILEICAVRVCICVRVVRRRQSARLQATALPISSCRFYSCCCYYCCWSSGRRRQRDSALQLFNCGTSYKRRVETVQVWVAVVETLSLIHCNYYHSGYISPSTGNWISCLPTLLLTIVLDGSLFINHLPNPLLAILTAAHSISAF